jgi:hypothetical protein
VVVLRQRGTFTLSTTGFSPMETVRSMRQRNPCRTNACPSGGNGSTSGSSSKMTCPAS